MAGRDCPLTGYALAPVSRSDDRVGCDSVQLPTLMNVLQAKDDYTARHCKRVMQLTVMLCEDLQVDRRVARRSEMAALYHDIGKLGVTSDILNKPGRLEEKEWETIYAHPILGGEILSSVAECDRVAAIIRQHHEDWDGTGYPLGLQGDHIALEARLLHVCDVYDALTSDRPYRPAYSHKHAISLIRDGAGREFDPEVAHAFIRMNDCRQEVA
ncbi:MAG: HD-GYP domain-containing protein [Armatimonadota bacterium]